MKKILLSTVVLLAFSLSIIIFQVSCKKEATAQSSQTSSLGVFLYTIHNDNTLTTEYYIANNDGTNSKKVIINLPTGLKIASYNSARLTPDGKTIIFSAVNSAIKTFIYSTSIDGTNLKRIVDGTSNTGVGIYLEVLGTY